MNSPLPHHKFVNGSDSGFSSSTTISESSTPAIPMCFAINAWERCVCLVSVDEQKLKSSRYVLLEEIPDSLFRKFGEKIDDEIVDEKNDNYVHCGDCECFYTYSCLEHPLYRALDRNDESDDGPLIRHAESRAIRTLPNYLFVTTSLIPNAGRGVFTKVNLIFSSKKYLWLRKV